MNVQIDAALRQKLNSRWNSSFFAQSDRLIPWSRLYMPCGGRGEVRTATRSYTLEPGKMLLIPSLASVRLSCDEFLEKYWSHFNLSFDDGNWDFFVLFSEPVEYVMKEGEFSYYSGIFDRLCSAFRENGDAFPELREIVTRSALLLLLEPFMRQVSTPSRDREFSMVLKIINIMRRRDFARIDMSELGKQAGIAPDHLADIFRRGMGCTPARYMREQRLHRAVRLLDMDKDLPIGEIAEKCGYENVASFSKAFHERYGIGPRDYRKKRAEYDENGS